MTAFAAVIRLLTLAIVVTACRSADRATPLDPSSDARTNLRLVSIQLSQATQDERGTLPMVAGMAAVLNIVVVRSTESVSEVPLVLRLFRGGAMVFTDTTRTQGVLGPLPPASGPNAQFLIPDSLVTAGVSWQVELDPLRAFPDSTRTDNLLPTTGPDTLNTVTVPSMRIRLVPIILSRHGGIAGDVSTTNAELYVMLARKIFPMGALTVTVGTPITSAANFGPAAAGADFNFWNQILLELDAARDQTRPTDEYWYGVVRSPSGYARIVFGGYGYIPNFPESVGPGTRSGAGLGVSIAIGMDFAQQTFAHELGHNFGRSHAPGCGAEAPIDSGYRGLGGSITVSGNDVWSWSNGFARSAVSIRGETGDVMSYCQPKWIGPYTYGAVLAWRRGVPVLGQFTARRERFALP
jgi:hypothetical protein